MLRMTPDKEPTFLVEHSPIPSSLLPLEIQTLILDEIDRKISDLDTHEYFYLITGKVNTDIINIHFEIIPETQQISSLDNTLHLRKMGPFDKNLTREITFLDQTSYIFSFGLEHEQRQNMKQVLGLKFEFGTFFMGEGMRLLCRNIEKEARETPHRNSKELIHQGIILTENHLQEELQRLACKLAEYKLGGEPYKHLVWDSEERLTITHDRFSGMYRGVRILEELEQYYMQLDPTSSNPTG
jgi:hypothetical protein